MRLVTEKNTNKSSKKKTRNTIPSMLGGPLMKELLLFIYNISCREEYVGPFLPELYPQGRNLTSKILRRCDFISFSYLKNNEGSRVFILFA